DRTAGVGFSVSATAEDAFENPLGSDYSGTPTLSGARLAERRVGKSIGCSGPCTASYGSGSNTSGGVTWTGVTGYKAESGRQLKADDGSGHTGTSGTFAISPGGCDPFACASVTDRTAGVGFSVSATAEDAFENPLGSDYSGTPTLSGA